MWASRDNQQIVNWRAFCYQLHHQLHLGQWLLNTKYVELGCDGGARSVARKCFEECVGLIGGHSRVGVDGRKWPYIAGLVAGLYQVAAHGIVLAG